MPDILRKNNYEGLKNYQADIDCSAIAKKINPYREKRMSQDIPWKGLWNQINMILYGWSAEHDPEEREEMRVKMLNDWLNVYRDPNLNAYIFYAAMKWEWTAEGIIDLMLKKLSWEELKQTYDAFGLNCEGDGNLIEWLRDDYSQSAVETIYLILASKSPYLATKIAYFYNNKKHRVESSILHDKIGTRWVSSSSTSTWTSIRKMDAK